MASCSLPSYPGSPKGGTIAESNRQKGPGVAVFHAGTTQTDGGLVASGPSAGGHRARRDLREARWGRIKLPKPSIQRRFHRNDTVARLEVWREAQFVLAVGLLHLCRDAPVHGPAAPASGLLRLSATVRVMLDNYEMQAVRAEVHRGPLDRSVLLAGPADDFQRGEIKRMSETLPGVAAAQWIDSPVRGRPFPLLAEVTLMSLACFAAGLVMAYLVALRLRARDPSRL